MEKEIKEKIRKALSDCPIKIYSDSHGTPSEKYNIMEVDEECEECWQLIDPIPSEIKEEINKYLGTDVILVAFMGEDSITQLLDIKFGSEKDLFATKHMVISTVSIGVKVMQANGPGSMDLMLISESNYPIAQFLTLLDGWSHLYNNGLPEGVTIENYIEYGKEVLNLECIN